jgi:hypothetical protein
MKSVSRKGAKNAKRFFTLWFYNPNDVDFLCELGVVARNFLPY